MTSARDRINERLTETFINDNPVLVTLSRPVYGKTDSGGRGLISTETVPEQKFTKIAPAFRSGGATGFTTEDGQVVGYDFVLVGHVDADIRIDDEFVLDNEPYKVNYVDESRQDWAKRAAVTRRQANG